MKTHHLHLAPAAAAFVAALGMFAGIAQGHHSFAMYDLNKTYLMTGVVVRVDPNPNHLQIFFAPLNDARDQVIRDGKNQPVVWAIEMDSAGVARRPRHHGQQFSARPDPERGCASAAQRFAGRRPWQERFVQVPGGYAAPARQALRFGQGFDVARRRRSARVYRSHADAEDELAKGWRP
jgi:hypothetical protein